MSFKVGQAPWETGQPESFRVGEAPWEKKPRMGEGLLRGALEALPAAGSIAGGVIGAPLGPLGIGGGGLLGAGLGSTAKDFLKGQLLDEPVSIGQQVKNVATEGLLEGAGVAAAGMIGKAAQLGKRALDPTLDMISKLATKEKAAAPALKESAERLGITPTRGMLTGDPTIQRIESGLAQRPSGPGAQMRETFEGVTGGLKEAGEKVFGQREALETPIQIGSKVKRLVSEGVEMKARPAVEIYQELSKDTPFIDLAPESVKRISRNIRSVQGATAIKGSPEAAFANQIADSVQAAPDLATIREIKSYVGKMSGDISQPGTMRYVAGQIGEKLTRLEQNAITRAALAAGRDKRHGQAVAKEMIGGIKEANKIYGQLSKTTKALAEDLGIGKVRNYQEFIREVQRLPDEQITQKFFNAKNINAMKSFQKEFPEAFEALRTAKLGEMYEKSLTRGEVSPSRLLNNVKKLSPEMREMLFGKDANQKLKDIELVFNNMPDRLGPSGTPEGMAFMGFNVFRPSTWFNSLNDMAIEYALKNPEKFSGVAQRHWAKKAADLTAPRGLQDYAMNQNRAMQEMADVVKSRLKYQTPIRAIGAMSGEE